MVRIRQVTALVALLGLASGCAGTKSAMKTEKMSQAFKEAVHLSPKVAPASEFQCGWQKSLAQLPDPTKSGTMIPGLVGQVFIFTADLKPAEITGELTVIVTDATVRPNAVIRQPNVWHFTTETLQKLVVMDERFGKSWVLFLPWPEDWADVNQVQVQARYDQPIGQTLYSQPSKLALESAKIGGSSSVVPTAGVSVPDPSLLMKNSKPFTAEMVAKSIASPNDGLGAGRLPTKVTTLPPPGSSMPPNMGNIQPASANEPQVPPTTNEKANDKEFGRIVIPRR